MHALEFILLGLEHVFLSISSIEDCNVPISEDP